MREPKAGSRGVWKGGRGRGGLYHVVFQNLRCCRTHLISKVHCASLQASKVGMCPQVVMLHNKPPPPPPPPPTHPASKPASPSVSPLTPTFHPGPPLHALSLLFHPPPCLTPHPPFSRPPPARAVPCTAPSTPSSNLMSLAKGPEGGRETSLRFHLTPPPVPFLQ